MKQRTCVGCGIRFSVSLPACPHCGRDISALAPKRESAAELAARFAPSPGESEKLARETAVRFGVDPDLPPKERCLAVAKAANLLALLPRSVRHAQEWHGEREPGQDDEEVAA